MTLTVKELVVDGVRLPTPALDGITVTTNKMWSANTGRLENTGEMVGTIICTKRKLEIKWPPMTMEQCRIIENAVSNMTAFHELTYTDMSGQEQTIAAYFGDPTYTLYSYSDGVQWVKDVTVSAVEK